MQVSGMAMSEEEAAQRAGPVGERPVLVEFKDSMHSLFGRSMGQVGQTVDKAGGLGNSHTTVMEDGITVVV
jgi:hypothetical protein